MLGVVTNIVLRWKQYILSSTLFVVFLHCKSHIRCVEALCHDVRTKLPQNNLHGYSFCLCLFAGMTVILFGIRTYNATTYFVSLSNFVKPYEVNLVQSIVLHTPVLGHLMLLHFLFLVIVVIWYFNKVQDGLETIKRTTTTPLEMIHAKLSMSHPATFNLFRGLGVKFTGK